MGVFETVCNRCGTPVGAEDIAAQGKAEVVKKLQRYCELLSETEELKSKIKPQSSFPMYAENYYKKRSFMKFFWPFMVGGIAAGFLVYIISIVISVTSIVNDYDMYSSYSSTSDMATNHIAGNVYGGYFVGLIVCAAIIVLGIFVSKKKQAAFNSNADFMNMQQTEKVKQGQMNQKMIDIYQEDIQEMHKYESLVPEEYRTFMKVSKIIELLKSDQAQTIEEAINLLG